MKKAISILSILTFVTCANAIDIFDILKKAGGLYEPLKGIAKVSENTLGQCYEPDNYSFDIDICSMVEGINPSVDVCGLLPPISGFTKKSNVFGLDKRMFCQDLVKKANTVLGDYNNWGFENIKNGKFGSGAKKKVEKFYKDVVKMGTLVNKKSLISNAYLNNKNDIVREILNYSKLHGVTDLSKVTIDDLLQNGESAPKDYKDYLLQRDRLSTLTNIDTFATSPLTVSEELRGSGSDVNGYISKAIKKIENNTPRRVGFEIDLQRKDDDFSIPTKEAVEVYVKSLQPQMLVKLKKQIKREARIKARVELEDKIKANIVQLVGKKTAIMNQTFDRKLARNEINRLIEETRKSEKKGSSNKTGLNPF